MIINFICHAKDLKKYNESTIHVEASPLLNDEVYIVFLIVGIYAIITMGSAFLFM